MGADTLFIKRNRPVSKVITASKTRPADTTAYTAGDVVAESTSAATVWTFAGAARALGLGGILQGAVFIDSVAQSTKPDLELYLFDTAVTTQNDNAAWAPTDADMEKCLGFIAFPSGLFKTGSGNGVVNVEGIAKVFQCASTSQDLFGILVVRNAYTPTSGEKLTIRLAVIQD